MKDTQAIVAHWRPRHTGVPRDGSGHHLRPGIEALEPIRRKGRSAPYPRCDE
jgi:hypothetical protein